MTGKELLKAIKATKGPLYVGAVMEGDPWVQVVRADMIKYLTGKGDTETGCKLGSWASGTYIQRDYLL